MTAETETAYYETFGCTDPNRDEWGDCVHEGDCTQGWACAICFRPIVDEPCPDHAPTVFPGLQLIECDATPKHWTWIHANDGYPPPCPVCALAAEIEAHSGCEHAQHGAWRSWKITDRVDRWGARIGLWNGFTRWTSGGGCKDCHLNFRWGPRFWVLGIRTDRIKHFLRYGHRFVDSGCYDLCDICCPDPDASAA